MSKKSRVLERSLTTVLGTAAHVVASDRANSAPIIPQETIAAIIGDAMDVDLLKPADVHSRITDLTCLLMEFVDKRRSKDTADALDCALHVLSKAFEIQTAAKIVAAKLLVERARKSNRFKQSCQATSRPRA